MIRWPILEVIVFSNSLLVTACIMSCFCSNQEESQPLERRNGTPLAAQDISNSSCTKDDRHRLGCCSGLAAGIYLLLVMACTAGVVLCCLLPYSCWFKIDAGIHTCRGMQNTTRLYPYRSEITLSSMGCWLLLQAISVAILLGRKSWFSRELPASQFRIILFFII